MSSKKKNNRQYSNVLTPYLFLLPNLLIFGIFIIIPMIAGFFYSLTEWDGMKQITFVGLDNYTRLFHDPVFFEAMLRTVVYVVITVPFIFFISLLLAYLLIKEIRMKGMFRAFFYWPTMLSMIIVGVTWKWILSDDFGIANYILVTIGLEPIQWLTSPIWAFISVIVATIWWRVGFYMVIFIAGLQAIPESYYEAANIDGASAWYSFKKITFPLLKPTSYLVLTLTFIDCFKSFGIVTSLTDGGPNNATKFIVQTIYEYAFERQGEMGYASAMSVVLFIVLATLTAIQFKFSKGGEV